MYFAALADVLEAGLHLREDADIAATADLVRGISRLNVIRAYLQPKSEASVNAVLRHVLQGSPGQNGSVGAL